MNPRDLTFLTFYYLIFVIQSTLERLKAFFIESNIILEIMDFFFGREVLESRMHPDIIL